MKSDARISDDGKYRHWLSRTWDEKLPVMCFIMLNPSTADASVDDMTIKKCIHYAKREGHGEIRVVNLFDYRATDPNMLAQAPIPASAMNMSTVINQVEQSAAIVVAWGANAQRPFVKEAALTMAALLREMDITVHCLGVTKDGHPMHPLMLRNDAPMVPWNGYR